MGECDVCSQNRLHAYDIHYFAVIWHKVGFKFFVAVARIIYVPNMDYKGCTLYIVCRETVFIQTYYDCWNLTVVAIQ